MGWEWSVQGRVVGVGALLIGLVGCGETLPRSTQPVGPMVPPTAPVAVAPPSPPPAADPFALPKGPRDEDVAESLPALRLDAWGTAKKTKGLATAPATCAAFASRAAAKPAPETLALALAEKEQARRDALLVALQTKPGENEGRVRALRADLAPIECADAIVDPYLEAPKAIANEDAHVLVGLSLASKLSRTALTPPVMGALREKEKVKEFIKGPLRTWVLDQSVAIERLASGAAGLAGYGRGIAAIEAGIAEMRLVDKIRSSPVPTTWDPELKAIYEAALDEALEPRKQRGRDAALVGMSDFARAGILRDARLVRARTLVSKLYGGRRVDALDALILPPLTAPSGSSPTDVMIANVSTFWVETQPEEVRKSLSVLPRGVTRTLRDQLRKTPSGDAVTDALRPAYARTRLDMGRTYWRRVDFVEAAYAVKDSKSPEDRLVLALALALVRGPNGALEMMRAASQSTLDLTHTEALDALVAENGSVAAMAAYDAAHLRALAPPDGAAAVAHLRDVAARFRKAEALFTDGASKKLAAQRAGDVDAIITELEKSPPR